MAEIDYQMALLLQHKFEQEYKQKKVQKTDTQSDYRLALALQEEGLSSKNTYTPSLTDSDQVLAHQLQEDFKREAEIERPANDLVYKPPKNASNSKCLVDPSWEVIDPTPNVHVLFIAFNEKFFWGTLGSVTVSWSKRMTTCAGICSYQGHGGLCSITLSEPLLKLRPRKDLVETLLHEMIHAYLFVTNNNRDRDGHGPEFHKHMYRINAEAGTNITVYHDFHDEVKLYQQHWWRCNGACQQRKPFFGMVRRAMNRPPGPNDNWWADHQRTCGGSFVKVKEPEKVEKPAKGVTKKVGGKTAKIPAPTKPGNDIGNYIPVQNKGTASETKENKVADGQEVNNKTVSNNTKTSVILDSSTIVSKALTNIHGISNNNSNSKITNVIPSKISNIHGFTNLSTPKPLGDSQGGNKTPGFGVKGAAKNAGSSTLVVNNKPSTVVKNGDVSKPSTSTSAAVKIFNGSGYTLTSSKSISEADYSVVRNHWLNKFDNSSKDVKKPSESSMQNSKSGGKRTNSTPVVPSKKVPRLSLTSKDDSVEKSECPVCKKQIYISELNNHLDDCLILQDKDTQECIICGKHLNVSNYELHVSKCCEENFNDNDEVFEVTSNKVCLKCNKKIKREYFDSHFELCGDDFMDLTKSPSNNRLNRETKNCPVCKLSLHKSEFDVHVEQCLMKIFDNLEEKYEIKTDEKTPCLACGKNIMKSELDSHLEDCINMSKVFDTANIPIIEDEALENQESSSEDSFNCPLCLQLVVEKDMQAHLDKCLNEVHCSEEAELNKSIVLTSFNED